MSPSVLRKESEPLALGPRKLALFR